MKILRLAFISFVTLLMACSSGKKAFEHGNYYEAVNLAVNRLRQNPSHSKSAETLREAYPLALSTLETEVNNQIASNNTYKWKNVINSYNQINSMYEQIRQCPGCLKVIANPKNYYSEMGPLKEKAAEESYNAGINALLKGTRNDAKQAYFNFSDAQAYVTGYKDVIEYQAKALDVATLKVILEQIPVPARYNLSGGFFQDKVEEFLHNNYQVRSFIKFYTPQEASSINLQSADQIMRIQFDDFTVGNTTLNNTEQVVTRDSVKVGETKVNGKTIPVYNTVKAKLYTHRKEVISAGLLSMVVVDAKTNGVLTHRKFEGNFVWGTTWANFNGDDRALTKEQLSWCNQKEQAPPPPQDLFLQFTRPIYDQLIPAIKGFYQNY
ncbi:MAG TPA: hypothetical protein VIM65_05210 [Cyclobacteriaceae bacterium]